MMMVMIRMMKTNTMMMMMAAVVMRIKFVSQVFHADNPVFFAVCCIWAQWRWRRWERGWDVSSPLLCSPAKEGDVAEQSGYWGRGWRRTGVGVAHKYSPLIAENFPIQSFSPFFFFYNLTPPRHLAASSQQPPTNCTTERKISRPFLELNKYKFSPKLTWNFTFLKQKTIKIFIRVNVEVIKAELTWLFQGWLFRFLRLLKFFLNE